MANGSTRSFSSPSQQLLLLICLFAFVMAGCGRGPDRVVGETAEWTFEDYKKARDAASSDGSVPEDASGTKP